MNSLVATVEQTTDVAVERDTSTAALILDEGNFTRLMAMAEVMATGRSTVPKHLQGNKGDCLAVCIQAAQWKMNPFAVAQKTHLVNGTLGYEAQLVIAVINTSGAIVGRLDWEWFGPWEKIVGKFKAVESKTKKDDDGHAKKYIVPDWKQEDEAGLGVIVRATLRGETKPRELVLLLTQARTRNSTLWTEDPKQQLAYLAGKRWSRLYTPEVVLGVYTPDELQEMPPKDMGSAEVVGEKKTAGLGDADQAAWQAAAEKGTSSARAHWGSMTAEQRGKASEDLKKKMWEIAVDADKKRTVDVPAKDAAKPAATPAADASAKPAATAEQAADPGTGEVDDAFVSAMNAAEKAQSK